MTLEQEARHMGVEVLPPEINRSNISYDLESGEGGRLGIRKALTSIDQLSGDDAPLIVWERMSGPFESLEALYMRVPLSHDVLENLAQSGARRALRGQPDGGVPAPAPEEPARISGRRPMPGLSRMPVVTAENLAELPRLEDWERIEWDYLTHGAGLAHPMTLHRRRLGRLGVLPIGSLWPLGRKARCRARRESFVITTAGICIARQKPPTAGGVMFLMLEDEGADIQCVCRPEVLDRLDEVLRAGAIVVRGELSAKGNWRGLVVMDAWPLAGAVGGFEGHPNQVGGKDQWVRTSGEAEGRQALPAQSVTAELVLERARKHPSPITVFVA